MENKTSYELSADIYTGLRKKLMYQYKSIKWRNKIINEIINPEIDIVFENLKKEQEINKFLKNSITDRDKIILKLKNSIKKQNKLWFLGYLFLFSVCFGLLFFC